MAELSLHNWQERPYGWRATGNVDEIPIIVRAPNATLDDDTVTKVINFNGWTAGQKSMARPASIASRLGYASITFEYTSVSPSDTLKHNAEDGLKVIDALPKRGPLWLVGLSMGGAVSTIVASEIDKEIDSLRLVAPSGYIHDISLLPMSEIMGRIGSEMLAESHGFFRHPIDSSLVAISGLLNSCRRPLAVFGESRDLTSTTVYDQLSRFRSSQSNPHVVLAHGSNDDLVPRGLLLKSIAKEELNRNQELIDAYIPYDGTHTHVVFDDELNRQLFSDSRLAESTSEAA